MSINDDENFQFLDSASFKDLKSSISHVILPEKIRIKARKNLENKMKQNDRIALILGTIGIFTNILQTSLYLEFTAVGDSSGFNQIVVSSHPSTFVTITRFITMISTILLLFLIYRHYVLYIRLLKLKDKISCNATILNKKVIWILISEMMMCVIFTPPYVYSVINLNVGGEIIPIELDLIISSIIPCRCYLLLKYFYFYSTWADEHAEKICNDCNTEGGIYFAIKAELKERPYTIVSTLMIGSILIFGFALRNAEASMMRSSTRFQDWRYVWNGYWCVVITLLTVGFGDFYPQTLLGRFIAVVACLWGTFLISLMVVSLTNSVEFTVNEANAYAEIKLDEMNIKIRRHGVELIRNAIKLKKFPKNKEEIVDNELRKRYINEIDKFKYSLHRFRTERKFNTMKELETSAENIMGKLNENVSEKMVELISYSKDQIDLLEYYLNMSKDIHLESKIYTDKLERMTQGLFDIIK